MAQAVDVAAYILNKCGTVTAMKLQKLVYYSQAWHLAWEERPLFDEPIQAWANGPVVRSLFEQHRGYFEVRPGEISGDAAALDQGEIESIDAVLDFYCNFTPTQLSELTHSEMPWQRAREGLAPGERGDATIQVEDMIEYYSSMI